jgi:hypothetical protein
LGKLAVLKACSREVAGDVFCSIALREEPVVKLNNRELGERELGDGGLGDMNVLISLN